MMLKVAVVILNWNGEHFLRQFLPGVLRHSCIEGCGVYVADNGSTDGSLALLDNDFKDVVQIRLPQNYGFAEGYNRALQQIEAQYFVLLNSDVEVTDGWLQPLIEFMDANSGVAACAPKIMDFSRRDFFEYAGAAGGFIDRFGYPFCRGRMLSVIEPDMHQYDDVREVFWASGACMFVRASAYLKLGGLDDSFFAHMEEIDLCWRFHNAGYSVWSIPSALVYHVGGGTLPNNNPRKLYLNYRNSLFMLHKNLHPRSVVVKVMARLVLDWLSAFAYLVNFNVGFFKAVFKAHRDYFRSFRSLNRFRNQSSYESSTQSTQIFRKSLLFHFFVLRRKKFSTLKF